MSDKPGKNTDAWLADEARVSRAYRQLELDQIQPPKHLDLAILAEARRVAASQDNTVIRVQRWRKWTMPAALAATVVFAIPLVVRVFDTAPTGFERGRAAKTTMAAKTTSETDTADVYRDLAEQEAAAPARADHAQSMFDEQRLIVNAAAPAEEAAESFPATEPRLRSAAEPSSSRQNQPTNDSALAPLQDPASSTALSSIDIDRLTDSAFAGNGYKSKPDAGLSLSDSETDFAQAPATAPDNTADLQASPKQEPWAMPAADRNSRRAASHIGVVASDDGPGQAGSTTTAGEPERKREIVDGDERAVTANRLDKQWLEPRQWLDDIARLHKRGQRADARRELGLFYSVYPDFDLPTNFPLGPEEAQLDESITFDSNKIVPEATTWLRGIGLMAYRGQIDQARTQLSQFFQLYPDYPLPADFPLRREDARPIER